MILESNKIYELGKDIPYGWYSFFTDGSYDTFFSTSGKVAVNFLMEKDSSSYKQEYDYYFTVKLTPEKCRFIEVLGGKGRFYDFSPLRINNLVLNPDNNGIVFEDELFKVEVLSRIDKTYCFDGPYPIDVVKCVFFKVNDLNFFIGQFDFTSLEMWHSIEIGFLNQMTNGIEKIDTEVLYKMIDKDKYPFGFCLFAKVEETVNDYTKIYLIEANGQKVRENIVAKAEAKYYKNDSEKFRQLINEFNNTIHHFDIDEELVDFNDCKDLIPIVNKSLEHLLQKREEYKKKDSDEILEYIVKPFYDKSFYEIAILSNEAEDVYYDNEEDKYHIFFKSTQVYEIELMTFLTKYKYLNGNILQEVSQNKETVLKHSYLYYEIDYLDNTLIDIRQEHGYSGKANNSILLRIIKEDKKELRRRANQLYKIAKEEGIINSKWNNEFRLYSLISRYVEKVYYQYRADWLGNQSLDIYISEQKIAIEYQGRQHFEPIDYFGGEAALYNNKRRDNEKRIKCNENGVILLEWNYESKVNKHTVLDYLEKNHIEHSPTPLKNYENMTIGSKVSQKKK